MEFSRRLRSNLPTLGDVVLNFPVASFPFLPHCPATCVMVARIFKRWHDCMGQAQLNLTDSATLDTVD